MASHGIGNATRALLEEFTNPEGLAGTVSQSAKATVDSAQEIKDAYRHISHYGKYTKIGGMLPGLGMHVARLTPEQVAMVNMIDPEILTKRRKFYFWLENIAKGCDVRGKVQLY